MPAMLAREQGRAAKYGLEKCRFCPRLEFRTVLCSVGITGDSNRSVPIRKAVTGDPSQAPSLFWASEWRVTSKLKARPGKVR